MENCAEKTISSKKIFDGKIISVSNDEVELPDGTLHAREVVRHKGGVVVVSEKSGRVLMVKQFRYPLGQETFELPAGKLDREDETPLDTAKRELEEETGHTAKHWGYMGYIYTTPGFCDEKLHLFLAQGLTYDKTKKLDDEIIDFYEIDKDEVFEMIKVGTVQDAKSISAIFRAYSV